MITTKINKIRFSKKPISIPAEYRISFKIAQIILILKICSIGSKASLLKLHLLSWALKSEENKKKLKIFIENNFIGHFKTWGIEPALNRALSYAVAENLCVIENGKYKLSKKGDSFYDIILKNEDLQVEIDYLKLLGKRKITDKQIFEIAKMWELSND